MNLPNVGFRSVAARWRQTSESPASRHVVELRQSLESAGANASDPAFSSLRSLAEERDPDIFFHGILFLGRQALSRDPARAGIYFQYLNSLSQEGPWQVPARVAEASRAELEALQGRGPWGRRLEFAGRRFSQEVLDPGMLAGMGVASTVFSGFRLVGLSRLALRPASFLTRGMAAELLVGSGAFAAEAGSFWLTNRLYLQAVHPERVSWSSRAVVNELWSTSLMLGLLKFGGLTSQKLFDRIHGCNPMTGHVARLPGLARFSRPFFHQAGMYLGIAGSHWIEAKSSGRDISSDALLVDSLLTLANFNIAAHLSRALMGPRHAALLQEMALRIRRVSSDSGEGDWLGTLGLRPGTRQMAVTPEGSRFPPPDRPSELKDRLNVFMVGDGEGEGKGGGEKPLVTTTGSSGLVKAAPHSWDPTAALEAIIESLRHNRELSPEEKARLAAELAPHLVQVHQILARRMEMEGSQREETGGIPEKERLTPEQITAILYRIKRHHFEVISDELQTWWFKFGFLRTVVRQQAERGTRKQRTEARRLLDSVMLKYLESRRYHSNAEAEIGDDRGPHEGEESRRIFRDENYSALIRKNTDILARLEQYIQARPILGKILAEFPGKPFSRFEMTVSVSELEVEIAKLGLPDEMYRLFCETIDAGDPLLHHFGNLSLHRLLRRIHQQKELSHYVEARQPLDRYLKALSDLRGRGVMWKELAASLKNLKVLSERWDGKSSGFPAGERTLSAPATEADTMLLSYLEAAQNLAQQLHPYWLEFKNYMRVDWEEVRGHLERLGDRQLLPVKTVRGLLSWFDPQAGPKRNATMHSIRDDSVAGLIDFIAKGTHSQDTRNVLGRFLNEVLRRDDERMLEILAIHFQNYQLGMMRDRIQVREYPSDDPLSDQMAIEAYDQFLEAILATAKFYQENPKATGLFFDIFDKLALPKDDSNHQLATPILLRAHDLLGAGYHVNLFSRGGVGEGMMTAEHPTKGRKLIAVTSLLLPVKERADLEVWLDRAERELFHNGAYRRSQDFEVPRFISIHLPRIRSGVAKDTVLQWISDYMKTHDHLAGIDVYLPDKGSEVADIADRAFYRRVSITPGNLESTDEKLARLVREVRDDPENLDKSLELYRFQKSRIGELILRMRRVGTPITAQERKIYLTMDEEISGLEISNWVLLQGMAAQRMAVRNPMQNFVHGEMKRVLKEWYERIQTKELNYLTERRPFDELPQPLPSGPETRHKTFADFLEMTFGVRLTLPRVKNLFDLAAAGVDISDFRYVYTPGELKLNGHIHRQADESPQVEDTVPDVPVLTDEAALLEGDRPLDGPPTVRDLVPPVGSPTIVIRGAGEVSDTVVPPEPLAPEEPGVSTEVAAEPEADHGSFSVILRRFMKGARSRNRPLHGPLSLGETLELELDSIKLPKRMKGLGIGRDFFGEIIRLGQNMGARRIFSPQIRGEGRLKLALYGMQYSDPKGGREMLHYFVPFLEDQLDIPAFQDYDFSNLARIHTPQQLACCFLDPQTRSLNIDAPPLIAYGMARQRLPAHHFVGRAYLLSDAPSWSGEFLLNPDSESLKIFHAYYEARMMGRTLFDIEDGN